MGLVTPINNRTLEKAQVFNLIGCGAVNLDLW